MNNTEFNQVVEQLLSDCKKTLTSKGSDYTRGDSDRLINFKRSSEALGVNSFQVLGVFLRKQMDPIWKYIKSGSIESEPIQSRIVDSINYLILLYALIAEDNNQVTQTKTYEKCPRIDWEQFKTNIMKDAQLAFEEIDK